MNQNMQAALTAVIGPIAGEAGDAAGRLADKPRSDIPLAASSALTIAESYLNAFVTAETPAVAEAAFHSFNVFAGLFHALSGGSVANTPNILAVAAAVAGRDVKPPAAGPAAPGQSS